MHHNVFIYLEFIREIVLSLPGVTEKTCFGTPAFYVNKKLFTRLKEDGETLAIYTEQRDMWLKIDPNTFFVTDHYLNYSYMLVRLESAKPAHLEQLLITAWRNRAPKRLLKEYDHLAGLSNPSNSNSSLITSTIS